MQEPSGAQRTPDLRPRRGLLILLAMAAGLALLVTLAAPPLLERAAIRALESRGLAPAQLHVDSLGPTGLQLSAISLGREPAVEIRRLRIEVSPLGLLRGRLEAIEVVAASLRGRLKDGTLQLGDLVIGGGESSDEGGLALPMPKRVRIEDLQLSLASELGRFEGEASVELELAEGPSARGRGTAALRLDDTPLATFELEAEDTTLSIATAADFDAATLRELGLPDLDRLRLVARLSSPTREGSLASRLESSEVEVEAELATRRPATKKMERPGATPLALQARVDLSVRGGLGHLDLAVRGPGPADQPLRIGDATATSFGLAGDFAVQTRGDGIELRADSCLAWQLRGAAWSQERGATRESKGCLHSGEGPLLGAQPGEDGWDVSLDLVSDETQLAVEAEGEPWLEGEAPQLHVRLDAPAGAEPSMRLQVEGGQLRLSNGAASLADVKVDWSSGEEASFRLGRVELGDPPAVRPLTLSGRSSVTAPFEFHAELRDGDGELRLSGAGRHDPSTGSGTARIDLRPVKFRSGAGAFQPERLFPVLGAGVGAVDATLDGHADLGWKGSELSSRGQLRLEGGDLAAEGWGIEGLAGSLDLVSLWPLESAPGQRLSFRRLRAGLPLEDGEIHLRIGPGWEQLELESASGRVAQGLLRVKGQLDFEEGVQQLYFRVAELSLSELVELAEVDRLEVSGTLAGELPLVIRGSEATVLRGKLVADPPSGSIRYRPETPPAALAGLGAQGELVLQALEDFQYESLEVDLELAAGGEARVVLSLKGSNPAIEGGRPFHLNLDLSGPLLDVMRTDPLMRDVVERFSRGALERATAPRAKE